MESFIKAIAVSEAAGLKKAIADSHEEIAELRYTRKEMDAAAMEVDKAIELARQVGERDLLSYVLHTRGLILRDTGKIDEAIDSMQEAVRVIESIRSELGSSEEKAGFLEQRREIYEDLILLLNQQGKTSEAFDFAQRSKARAFLDLLGEWNIDIEKNLPHDLREKKEKLINEMMDVQGEIRDEEEKDTPAKAKVASLEQKSNQLDGDYRTLIREIRKQAPQLAVVRYPEPLDVSQSQALLDDQTVLLEYFVGKEGSLVFAITSDSLKTYPVPPEKNLSGMISEIRDALQKPDPVMQASEGAYVKYLKSSDALYRALFSAGGRDNQWQAQTPDCSRWTSLLFAI